MYVYHEIDSSTVDEVLIGGLKLGDRGEKGDDEAIVETDKLLDKLRPDQLVGDGLSRGNNIYAYVADGDEVIDIVDGEVVDLDDFVAASSGVVLRINVDSERCYVSDLDIYDDIKALVEGAQIAEASRLADDYWRSILPLTNFDVGDIDRPEVMITYDIEPQDIEVCR